MRLRYKYLLDKRMQLEVTLYFIVIQACALISIYLLYTRQLAKIKTILSSEIAATQGLSSMLLDASLDDFTLFFLQIGAAGVLFSILGGILVTHRAAGPIYRLSMHLRAVISGESRAPLRFRKGDYFLALPDLVNQAIKPGGNPDRES